MKVGPDLAELLSAFKDAADDAETLKQREINRLEHEQELASTSERGGRCIMKTLKVTLSDVGRLEITCEAQSTLYLL